MKPLANTLCTLIVITCLALTASAQTAESVYDRYTDFNLARLQGESGDAFKIAGEVMPNADKLPPKSRTSFYNSVAKLYEDAGQFDKAQPLYEKVAAAAPDYYVVHLALGHIYLNTANTFAAKMNAAAAAKDKTAYQQAEAAYKAGVAKALPHLEKAQACDPNEPNLTLIKSLYKNIKNEAALATLNARIKQMSVKCEDLLNEN